MENYSYSSYPDSGESSPRSREIEFDNPPWEDPSQPQIYKVKFMCSYGGKIHPRPHDNQLSYIGGETKILSVDRGIKFANLISKLSALCDETTCVSFKYQLPGEDLDALISVTNDDDLDHMMHEYDRLQRASGKPARLRLFLFPVNPTATGQGFGSGDGRTEKERFVEALNSGPIQPSQPQAALAQPGNVDFLFGLEKGMAPQPPALVAKVRDPVLDSAVHEPEIHVPGVEDRGIGLDPIQKHIQDLQRLRLAEEQAMYRRKSDDIQPGVYGGEYYAQKGQEKVSPTTFQVTGPVPAGYWPDKHVPSGVYHGNSLGPDQPVYVIPAPAPTGVYHAPPMGRQVTGPTGQGYYAVQRVPQEVYREPQVYNVMPPPALPPQAAPKVVPAPTLPHQALSISSGGVGVTDTGFTQVSAYDSGVGRQVYYTAAGGVMAAPPPVGPQYQQIPSAVSSERGQQER